MEINDFLPSRAHNKTGYFDELIRIENKAINSLRLKGRTTSQIAYVRKLIVELIEIYFDEERKSHIESLREQALIKLSSISPSEDIHDSLYPFALVGDCYGSSLEFVGNEDDLDLMDWENIDEVDALFEIIDWMKDNETEEGFIDAENYEYFYVLALSYYYDVSRQKVEFKSSLSLDDKLTFEMLSFNELVRSISKCMKAMSFASEMKLSENYERKISAYKMQVDELKAQLQQNTQSLDDIGEKQKKRIQKATDNRHFKNREARALVCEHWLNHVTDFKTSMVAAEFYKAWLSETGYFYSLTTIRNWVLMHAKKHGVKW